MLAASHALIGAAIASLIPRPELAIPLNLSLHFAADLVPHWDLNTRKSCRDRKTVIALSLTDAGIGYWLGWQLFAGSVSWPYLVAMMLIAQLPDWIEAPYRLFNWQGPFVAMKRLQSRCHHKLGLPWGLVIQAAIVTAVIILAKL